MDFEAAYGCTIEKAADIVFQRVHQLLRRSFPAQAEDVAADVMEKLCRNAPARLLEKPEAWVGKVARHHALTWLESQRAVVHGGGRVGSLEALPFWQEFGDEAPSPEEAILYAHLLAQLLPHMEAVCSQEELAVWRLELDGRTGWLTYLTNTEIAQRLGRAKGSVGRWRAGARRKARDFIRTFIEDDGAGTGGAR